MLDENTVESAVKAAMGHEPTRPAPVLVDESVIVEVLDLGRPWLQKDRWQHGGQPPGLPFTKIGTRVKYDWREITRILSQPAREAKERSPRCNRSKAAS